MSITRPKRVSTPKYALVQFIVDKTLLVVKTESEVDKECHYLLQCTTETDECTVKITSKRIEEGTFEAIVLTTGGMYTLSRTNIEYRYYITKLYINVMPSRILPTSEVT